MKKFLTLPLFLGACCLLSLPIMKSNSNQEDVAVKKMCITLEGGHEKGKTICISVIVPTRG